MGNPLLYINAINIAVFAKIGALEKIERDFEGDWERAWRSNLSKYLPNENGEETIVERSRHSISPEKEWEWIKKENIRLITIRDSSYPEKLRHIADPPFMLYIKGDEGVLNSRCFAIVGTRRISDYGKRATPAIAADISAAGFTIVSGLAAGVDSLAHKAAVQANSKTIAVLGCGIDEPTIFPPQNINLARKIIETGGAIISEYAPKTRGRKFTFPQRNRIISGLSEGTLVIEAGKTSGALITASCAIDQNRDVFAVPGSIFAPTSRGTNSIIKMGAKAVTCAEDILEDYEITMKEKPRPVAETPEEEKIMAALAKLNYPGNIEEIIKTSGLAPSVTTATLTFMELNGKVKEIDGRFSII